MSDVVERLLDSAVEALQTGQTEVCISLTTQALAQMERGDRRYPEALSLRGTARMKREIALALADLSAAVELDPDEPQFLANYGQALFRTGQVAEAGPFLERAFRLSKGNPAVAGPYSRCLLALGKPFQAVQVLGPLVESGRADSALVKLFSEALYASGDVFTARDILMSTLSAGTPTPGERLQLARLDMTLRDYASAEQNLRAVLSQSPESVPALCSAVRLMDWTNDREGLEGFLTRLITLAGDQPEALSLLLDHADAVPADRLQRAEALCLTEGAYSEELAALGFSLALYYDRQKAFDRAFEIADRTNRALAAFRNAVQTQAAETAEAARFSQIREAGLRYFRSCTPVHRPDDDVSQTFVYLIGAPRSGSSLIQSVLSAAAGAVSVGERGALYPYLSDAAERGLSVSSFERLAQQLAGADRAGLHRQGIARGHIIDKTPHNLYVAGLLALVHESTKFVQVFRDAGDVAVSMFLRPFSAHFPEATSLNALAESLARRCQAFRTWTDAGLEILPFSYEAFTARPADKGDALFSYLNLDWQERFLDPVNRPQAVPTFSSRQVRKAIAPAADSHWISYSEFAPEVFEKLAQITAEQNAITETKES